MASTINSIISALATVIKTAKPGCVVYADKAPQSFSKNSFYIQVIDHEYGKRIGNKYDSTVSFDISYFTSSNDVDSDCHGVAENIMRALDLAGTFRVQNKTSRITDKVLHILFDIKYSELDPVSGTKMATADVNSGIKEE